MHNSRTANLEFKITFSETNLRYLAGEPDTEKTRNAIKANLSAIEEAKRELAQIAKEGK